MQQCNCHCDSTGVPSAAAACACAVSDPRTSAIASGGGIEAACAALKAHKSSAEVQEEGMILLFNLGETGGQVQAIASGLEQDPVAAGVLQEPDKTPRR